MERINANEVQSMMEAYASIYNNQEQEVISEEVEVLDENRGNRARQLRAAREAKAAEQDRLYRAGGGDAKRRETRQMQGASSVRTRRPGMTRDQVIELGRKNLANKPSTTTGTTTGTAPAAPANNAVASKAAPVKDRMADASKEDRMAAWAKANPKLAAAKAQRDAAKAARSGASAGSAAASAAGSAAKPAAAGAAKPAGGKEDIFTSTPPGGKAYGNAAKPASKPVGSPAAQAAAGAPNRKEDLFTGKPIPPAGSAAKPAAATPVVKKPVRMGARNRMRMEELDVFETIKQYLVDEGYSEDEAIKAMTVLTDEERTEIIEGSCGSKKKKKGGYGK